MDDLGRCSGHYPPLNKTVTRAPEDPCRPPETLLESCSVLAHVFGRVYHPEERRFGPDTAARWMESGTDVNTDLTSTRGIAPQKGDCGEHGSDPCREGERK